MGTRSSETGKPSIRYDNAPLDQSIDTVDILWVFNDLLGFKYSTPLPLSQHGETPTGTANYYVRFEILENYVSNPKTTMWFMSVH